MWASGQHRRTWEKPLRRRTPRLHRRLFERTWKERRAAVFILTYSYENAINIHRLNVVNISDKQLISTIVDLFAAGSETSSNSVGTLLSPASIIKAMQFSSVSIQQDSPCCTWFTILKYLRRCRKNWTRFVVILFPHWPTERGNIVCYGLHTPNYFQANVRINVSILEIHSWWLDCFNSCMKAGCCYSGSMISMRNLNSSRDEELSGSLWQSVETGGEYHHLT